MKRYDKKYDHLSKPKPKKNRMLMKDRFKKSVCSFVVASITMSSMVPTANAIYLNGDFENGDFSHWTEGFGYNPGLKGSPPFTHKDIKINRGGKRILNMVGATSDPRAPHLTLPRQGNYTAKVNDEFNGAHLNHISQKASITEEDRDPSDGKLHVRFNYAAVLEDPGHIANNQPYFHVQLKDLTTDEILYEDFAYSNQPGREFYTTITYGNDGSNSIWRSTPFIDVDIEVPDTKVGHELEVRVIGAQCAQTGHGGYVYVDAFGAHKISPQTSCITNLEARPKPGKVQLTWDDIGVEKYRVYRSTAYDGPYVLLGETKSNYSTWLDDTVSNEQSYFYTIHPVDAEGVEICSSGKVISVVPEHLDPDKELNRPPYFTTKPKLGGDIRAPYSYQPVVEDADGDVLKYRLLEAPTSMTIDENTGEIKWAPKNIGVYSVNIEVEDTAGHKVTQPYHITVVDGNLPPKITNQIPHRIPAETYFSHQIAVTDPEGEAITYSLQSQASGMKITAGGRIYWSKPLPGRYPVTVVVSDPHGAKDKQSLVLVVTSKPEFVSTPVINATVNSPYQYQAKAFDVDGDALTYALLKAPSGMSIDAKTGVITWTPAAEGIEQVIVEVTDADNNKVKQTYQVKVSAEANHIPVITSSPVTYSPINAKYQYNLTATDVDGDYLEWSLLDAPDHMEINASTGSLIWKNTEAGAHKVVVQVSDRRGGLAKQEFTLRVGEDANHAPQITSIPNTISNLGAAYSYQLIAKDEDGDALKFSLTEGPKGSSVDANGLFSWAKPVLGEHQIKLRVNDGLAWVEQHYTLHIVDADTPILNNPPSITSTPTTLGVVNEAYQYQMVATDPDGDHLTYTLVKGPKGASLDANGLFTWAKPSLGEHIVKLAVSDGKAQMEQSFTLVITDKAVINMPPQIVSDPAKDAVIDHSFNYQLVATDPDGDLLIYGMEEGPKGASIDSSGLFVWEKPVQGSHPVKLIVSDGFHQVTQSFTINVTSTPPSNLAPSITSVPKSRTTVGEKYTYQIQATDPENDVLNYKLVEGPAGVTIDATGLLVWDKPALGEYTIKLEVSDGSNLVYQSYQLQVVKSAVNNQPPKITSIPVTQWTENQPYSYPVLAVDPDGDKLTYTLVKGPAGMAFDRDGILNWQKPVLGNHEIVIQVEDGRSYYQQQYKLNVNKPTAIGTGTFSIDMSADPHIVAPGENVSVNIVLEGGKKPYTVKSLTLDGKTVAVSGQTAKVSSTDIGLHTLVATVEDANGVKLTKEASFIVKDVADTIPPVVEISAPASSNNIGVAEVTTITDIVGTASDANIAEYQLFISPASENNWTSIAKGTSSVVNAKLGNINPQIMANGLYDLLLVATDNGGNKSSAEISVIISGEQKVGQFSLSFLDLDIDIGNLPLRLTRTYDTRRQHEKLDFGHGWSVDYQDVKIQTNGVPGRDWDLEQTGSGLNQKFCPRPVGSRIATIRLPDGKMERFKIGVTPDCNTWMQQLKGNFFQIKFEPMAGTTSTLEATDVGDLRVHGGDLFDYWNLDKVDPQSFKLTTRDGTVYHLDKSFGIKQIQDRFGNTLNYTKNGITHSNGASLIFTRDSMGRITQVESPDKRVLHYAYDNDGNLAISTDTQGGNTKFTYHQAPSQRHQLDEIIAPNGKRVFKAEFDDKGYLIGQTDGEGFKVNLEHDIDNKSDSVTDRNGNTTVYVYDDTGNIIEEKDALGNITKYTYDQHGNELTVTDALGNTTTREYNRYGEVTKETNALGFSTESAYNEDGNITVSKDELGREIKNIYEKGTGALTAIIDAMGYTTRMGYTIKGDLAAISDPLGNKTSYSYIDIGGKRLRSSQTDAAGNKTEYEYDAKGNQTAVKQRVIIDGKATEIITRSTYDDKGNVLTQTDENGRVTKFEYDKLDQLIKIIEPNKRVTVFKYDSNGNQVETISPDGRKEQTEFDGNGNELKSCIAGVCTETVYDARNLPTEVKDALGNITKTEYDANGQAVKTTDARGNITSFVYDAIGRQIEQKDALGNSVKKQYDAVGNLEYTIDALGYVTEHIYNGNNQRIQTILPNGSTIKYAYDAAGRNTAITDAENAKTQFSYDAIGQLYQVTDALNHKTNYGYDSRGRLILQTDANNHVTRFSFNKIGKRSHRILPLGQKENWSYNQFGQLEKHTDFNGKINTFVYDTSDLLKKASYADGREISYVYDMNGHIVKISDSLSGDVLYKPDLLGHTLEMTTPTGQLAYTWDANGNKTSQRINNSTGIQYRYDAMNRIESITAVDGSVISFNYDANGNRTQIVRANGTSSHYSYNEANQLTSLIHRDANNNILASFNYSLDKNGRRTQVIESINGKQRTVNYSYDATGKLLEEKITEGDNTTLTSYTYDAMGNRLSKTHNGVTTTYTYNVNDQLISEVTAGIETTYKWDANGNLTKKLTPQGNISYTWSSNNRLMQIDDQIKQFKVNYTYDGNNNRIGRTIKQGGNITETEYLVDNQRPYSEIVVERTRINNGAWEEHSYLHTPDGVGDLLIQTKAGATVYLYQDGQGSTRFVTDNSGAITETHSFDAFGDEIQAFGQTPTTTDIKHLYVGEYFDQEANFYHMRARDYSPGIGRFNSMDELGGAHKVPLTLNRYLYSNADPINKIDPSGYMVLDLLANTQIRQLPAYTIPRSMVMKIMEATYFAVATYSSMELLKKVIDECYKSKGKKCRIPNLLVIGKNYAEAQKHIDDAQNGYGSNRFPISRVVTYKHVSSGEASKARTYWRKKTSECMYNRGGLRDCDEYPFITTYEGGIERYEAGQVSLRPINPSDNQGAGRLWGRMVRRGKRLPQGTKVVVAPYGFNSYYFRDGHIGF